MLMSELSAPEQELRNTLENWAALGQAEFFTNVIFNQCIHNMANKNSTPIGEILGVQSDMLKNNLAHVVANSCQPDSKNETEAGKKNNWVGVAKVIIQYNKETFFVPNIFGKSAIDILNSKGSPVAGEILKQLGYTVDFGQNKVACCKPQEGVSNVTECLHPIYKPAAEELSDHNF